MRSPPGKRKQVHPFKETARNDPYRSQEKPLGTPRCPECKSINIRGRWLSPTHVKALRTPGLATRKLKCPACRQLNDRFAMGVIELHGRTWESKKDEVMNTIQNAEEIARNRNDQERVLWTQRKDNITKIYVSLPELARHIGRVLERSFKGKVEYKRSTEEPYLRVRWQSDLPHMKHRPGSVFLDEIEPVHKSKSFRSRSRRT